MAEHNRNQQSNRKGNQQSSQQGSQTREDLGDDDVEEIGSTDRNRSNREPASIADDRSRGDRSGLDSEDGELEDIDNDSEMEDVDEEDLGGGGSNR
jgi:hypothetical protein